MLQQCKLSYDGVGVIIFAINTYINFAVIQSDLCSCKIVFCIGSNMYSSLGTTDDYILNLKRVPDKMFFKPPAADPKCHYCQTRLGEKEMSVHVWNCNASILLDHDYTKPKK